MRPLQNAFYKGHVPTHSVRETLRGILLSCLLCFFVVLIGVFSLFVLLFCFACFVERGLVCVFCVFCFFCFVLLVFFWFGLFVLTLATSGSASMYGASTRGLALTLCQPVSKHGTVSHRGHSGRQKQ